MNHDEIVAALKTVAGIKDKLATSAFVLAAQAAEKRDISLVKRANDVTTAANYFNAAITELQAMAEATAPKA